MLELANHDLVDVLPTGAEPPCVRYETRPARRPDGRVAEGLHNV